MDERPAGFIALGIAQQINTPVVLICTSGSAAYNFAPAIAEAFFQQIPLLVLTADRPKEWQHQYDGQTIYQSEIYGKHVKRSFELSPDYQHKDVPWAINRIVNEALNIASARPFGPVHINVPIREPFYPTETESFSASDQVRIVRRSQTEAVLSTEDWNTLMDEWEDSRRILIAVGQGRLKEKLIQAMTRISEEWHIPVVADRISNLPGRIFIANHDLFLGAGNTADLKPDLLITVGLSFISKELKQFFRGNVALNHWHVGIDNFLADPAQSMTRQIPVMADYFFENIFEKIDYQLFVQNSDPENDSNYAARWHRSNTRMEASKQSYLGKLTTLTDLTSLEIVFRCIKREFQLHLANSMSVRYVNVLTVPEHITEVFANRGTSGIDGCVSTAIGAARVNKVPTLLIVGDVAFLYDRNGLLTKTLPPTLKILVLNNAGGNIFRMIDGPGRLPEMEELFETRHSFSARRTCEDSNIAYFSASDLETLENVAESFLESGEISLLEIFTDPLENERVWKDLKQFANSRD